MFSNCVTMFSNFSWHLMHPRGNPLFRNPLLVRIHCTRQIENPSISFDEYIANIKRGMGEGEGDDNPNPNPGSGGVSGNPGSGGMSGNSDPNPNTNPNHTPYTKGDDEKCSSKLGHTDPNKTTAY